MQQASDPSPISGRGDSDFRVHSEGKFRQKTKQASKLGHPNQQNQESEKVQVGSPQRRRRRPGRPAAEVDRRRHGRKEGEKFQSGRGTRGEKGHGPCGDGAGAGAAAGVGRRRRWRRWGEGGGNGERPEVHEGVAAFIGRWVIVIFEKQCMSTV